VLVTRRGDALQVVLQVDHQDQCALMAASWGAAGFARPEPYGPLETAAACHDEGWRPWEAAPEVDGEGRPLDFVDLDRGTHTALYRRGIAAAVERDPRAGLLVAMHGRGLYQSRLGLDGPPRPPEELEEPGRGFVREQLELEARLRAGLGGGARLERWAWAAYRLLQTWDTLSLYLIWGGLPQGRRRTLGMVPRRVGDPGVDLRLTPAGADTALAEPFPFTERPVALPVRARTIDDRRYTDADDLCAALAAAPWEQREYRLVAGRD
jgi:Protein of unknown function (DUF3891)